MNRSCIGFGVFLLAVGLVLALAVSDSVNGVDLTMIGWIAAGCGVLAIALSFLNRDDVGSTVVRRRRPRREVVVEDEPPVVEREREVRRDL